MRAMRLGILLMAAAGAAEAQPVGERVAAVRNGTVRFAYEAAEGVCGNGRGNISVRRGDARTHVSADARSREWEDACESGPVRVAIDVSRGQVTAVRAYVGGRWRGAADADLGMVPPAEASAFLLELAAAGAAEVAKDALFPATIARGVRPWPQLLRIAREGARPREVRSAAVFWVGREAAEAATVGLRELVEDPDDDREVRKAAVFALSQRAGDEAVPALIRIARTNRDPDLRRAAIFWLGQSRDARALAYFEELLAAPR